MESGGKHPVYSVVSRSQPGIYEVYIGGTQAGSLIIEETVDRNIVLLISCALLLSSVILGVLFILRRRKYGY